MRGGKRVTAFGPATVANVAVGFDALGFCAGCVGDFVTVEAIEEPGVSVDAVTGSVDGVDSIPLLAASNTAAVGVMGLLRAAESAVGMSVSIRKGIALGSGMGGSAASSVAAVVAANELLGRPFGRDELLRFAVQGEAVASGSAHADNAAPCLFGGFVLVFPETGEAVELPVPEGLAYAIARPRQRLDTRTARGVLAKNVALTQHVRQSASFAAFVAALYRADFELMSRALSDVVIEPQRKQLIPGFDQVQRAAIGSGALGASISGAGPAIFALAEAERAPTVASAMAEAFARQGIEFESYSGLIDRSGARVVESP
ncbi:MAG: homoserine kinase [Deltaproteobacteria bacterium]|nr:homoserine kinase [Deltaproteobacteria bacterium]